VADDQIGLQPGGAFEGGVHREVAVVDTAPRLVADDLALREGVDHLVEEHRRITLRLPQGGRVDHEALRPADALILHERGEGEGVMADAAVASPVGEFSRGNPHAGEDPLVEAQPLVEVLRRERVPVVETDRLLL